jgi:hypothetical protein
MFYIVQVQAMTKEVVYEWNNRNLLPISKLSLEKNKEYPNILFNPPLAVRGDGKRFLLVSVVDGEEWINIAINSLASLARYTNVSAVTVMTTNNHKVGEIFRRLGLYVYDAKDTIATFPPDFRLEHPLPSWSWGSIIFLRFNTWFEAFRRGVGFCSLDTDVTYNKIVLFAKNRDNSFSDISIQGRVASAVKNAENICKHLIVRSTLHHVNLVNRFLFAIINFAFCISGHYVWTQNFNDKFGYYLNPGFSCHTFGEGMLNFMQMFQENVRKSIKHKLFGWGQPAYMKNFCEGDFQYRTNNPDNHRWHWKGNLRNYNVSVSMFNAVGPSTPFAKEPPVLPEERRYVPAYHAKACHGGDLGNSTKRVKCKEDWLKQQGQWLLPDNLPRGLAAWLRVDSATLLALRKLLHRKHSV